MVRIPLRLVRVPKPEVQDADQKYRAEFPELLPALQLPMIGVCTVENASLEECDLRLFLKFDDEALAVPALAGEVTVGPLASDEVLLLLSVEVLGDLLDGVLLGKQ